MVAHNIYCFSLIFAMIGLAVITRCLHALFFFFRLIYTAFCCACGDANKENFFTLLRPYLVDNIVNAVVS